MNICILTDELAEFLQLPLLTADDVTAQIAAIGQALTARKTWLKQPQNRRDPAIIAGMFHGK